MRKRFLLSLISLSLSIMTFLFVTYAWFAVSTSVDNNPFGFSVDPGIITWDIHYYTYNDVFKLDGSVLKKWDGDSWEIPTYERVEDIGYNFAGMMMKPYDPIIPDNNELNHIIIEFHMSYEVDVDTTVNIIAEADTSLASNAISVFANPNPNPSGTQYYLSEIINIQNMVSSSYAYSPGVREDYTNLYVDLMEDFQDTVTYPKVSFYGITDTYSTTLQFDDMLLTQASSPGELYWYINISYYEDKIIEILTYENNYSLIDENLDFFRFYQDIYFDVRQDYGV
jgi:hypothetical protein